MKFLIDPDWKELAEDMTDAELGEIFRCILEYPARDVKSPLWKFIKKQLARDKIKYDEKVARLAKNTGRDNCANSDENHSDIAQKSVPTSSRNPTDVAPTSPAIKEIERNNPIKNIENANNALAVNRLIGGLARNMNPNRPKLYEINDNFDLDKLYDTDTDIQALCNRFPATRIERAQRSLLQKKYGEKLSLEYITKWVENEGAF